MKKYKVRVYIRLRESVSDAAGNAVMANCNKVAPDIKVEKLRINKIIEMLVSAESEEKAREQLDLLSDRLFANVVIEDWEYDLLPKKDGTPYNTEKGAFRGHPCTIWAAESVANTAWLIQHGFALLNEYETRYGKIHSCQTAMNAAEEVFEKHTGKTLDCHKEATPFAFAGPDEFKHDSSIDILTKYKRYIASKPWVCDNYLRKPDRKPDWV